MRPYFELTQYYYTMTKKNTKVAMQVRGQRGSYRSNKLTFCANVKQFYSPRIGEKIPIGLRTGGRQGVAGSRRFGGLKQYYGAPLIKYIHTYIHTYSTI